MKSLKFFLLYFVLVFNGSAFSQNIIIPKPQEMRVNEGEYQLGKNITVSKNKNVPEVKYLIKQLEQVTNHKIKAKKEEADIRFSLIKNQENKKEGYYKIVINNKGVKISAPKNKGLFYGIQTLLQIIEEHKDDFKLPHLRIEDYPKFSYRGMMLDVSRHFFGVDDVKKFLDYLATYKYNKFHWHLTDDQGWRIEIKKYPKLTEIGAWRESTQIGRYFDYKKYDSTDYGGYYTQDEIKEIVDYAGKLYIDVIPEIEMPGHAQAAIAAYPKLGCTKYSIKVREKWGVSDDIYCPKEKTFKFLEDVIDEVVELFPSKYIHIGGDEASKKQWEKSNFVKNVIKKKDLKNEEELQSYFITRMEKYINSKGKQIIGWGEILQGGLAPNATVMSWRGEEGGVKAAKFKHKTIMTPTSTNYFDYYQGNPATEPLAWGGDTRLDKVYSYKPIPVDLRSKYKKYIWGTQGNLWTEYISNFKKVEYMIFPRIMALSEVAWGTSAPNNYGDFEDRVINHFQILDRKGINYSKAIYEVEGTPIRKNEKLFYKLNSQHESGEIRYTINRKDPTIHSQEYTSPIPIEKNFTIKAAYFESGRMKSEIISQQFTISKSTGKKINLSPVSTNPYSENGSTTLIDGIRGDINNHRANWLGFKGSDVIALIDLSKKTKFSNVQFTSLSLPDWQIYFPKRVEILVSDNGNNFKRIKSISQKKIKQENGQLNTNFSKQEKRYIKLKLKNLGRIPRGLPGAGSDAYIFLDEIEVN